jgi:uncharacterized membrane protein YesL
MLMLNAAWFLLQLPLITSAPATAMVYALVQQSYDGEYWGPRQAWQALRALFWPAWRWGVVNAAVLLVIASNLAVYWNTPGALWTFLRLVWFVGLGLWVALNLFYWPFWLAQEDRSMRTTYANCGRFLLLNPGPAAVLVLLCLLLALFSVVTTLPFTLALACWLALIGVTAVQRALDLEKSRPPV